MAIVARFESEDYPEGVAVEIQSTFISGSHRLAVVKALHGLPFVGGDRWPVRSDGKIVQAEQLHQVHQVADECECRPDRDALCSLCQALSDARWGGEIPMPGYPAPRPAPRPALQSWAPNQSSVEVPYYSLWLSGVDR